MNKDDKSHIINNPVFNATKKKLLSISLMIVIFAMVFFSIVTLISYRIIVYSGIDSEITMQCTMLDKDIAEIQNKHFGVSPANENNFPRPPFSIIKDTKMISVIYVNDMLVYSTENTYIDNFKNVEKKLSNRIETFAYDSHSFRGIHMNRGDYSYIVFYNVDSEVASMARLAIVMGACLVVFMFVVRLLAVYLSNKAMVPVEKSYIKQVEFIQDASHEMRTPLAVIKGKLELLAVNPTQTIEDRYEDISEIMSEVVNMEKMNKNLLLLSKEDVGNSANIEHFELNTLIEQINDFFVDLAEAKEINFRIYSPAEKIIVSWDFAKIKQAITILLDNAFKYSNSGDSITLELEEKGKNIIICVSDTGCGIDEQNLHRIFDRFYRSESARASDIEGSGIGLSILSSLSRALDFKIDVTSKLNEGTEFTLTIPKIIKNK